MPSDNRMAIGSFGVTAIAEQDIAGAALHDLTHLFTRQNTLGKLRGALPVAKKDGLVGKREIGLGNLSKSAKRLFPCTKLVLS